MKIVALSGSLSADSNTGKGLKVALEAARQAGAEVEFYSLRERPLPIYDPEDDKKYEEANVAYFVKLMTEADGFIIGSPEYHNGISGVLKNALDFIGSTQFKDKPCGFVAAAGGAIATNTLQQMMTIIRSLHGYVVPQFGSIGYMNSFNEDGTFAQQDMQDRFAKIGQDVYKLAKALRG